MKSYKFKPWSMFMSLLLFSIMVLQLSSMNVARADSVSAPSQQNANQRYVASNGNDSNNDCADSNNPCQTIQHGIDEAIAGETVLVEPGTYVENINFNGKNIVVASLLVTTNDPSYIAQTVIDGNQNGSVVTFENGEDATAVLQGLTVTNGSGAYSNPSSYPPTSRNAYRGGGIYLDRSNPSIVNVRVLNNSAELGGGIHSIYSEPTILDTVISGNTASDGGGIYVENDRRRYLSLINVVISGNEATNDGGGIYANYSSRPVLTNVTITGNIASSGGAIWRANRSDVTVVNSIIWGNNPAQIHWEGGTQAISDISYSNIEGGQTGTYINWGAGNLDVSPQFVDAANGDFRLSDNSPLLGVGTLQNAPATDLDGNVRPSPAGSNPDLGAYESLPEPVLDLCGCEIDLVNNTHTCQDIDPISFVYGPATNQAVVKFGFDPSLYNHTAVRFDVEYGGQPNGWTVDIGDASTNNGWGGDAGLTSNAAEMQILNTTMDLYSNVLPGYQNVTTDGHLHLLGVPNVVSQGNTISLEVSDEHLGWQYPGASSEFNSPYLYTLNGQPTLYGSIDYDIYAGFNRTIGSGGRNGSGATKVTISCLQETEPVVNALTCDGAEGYPGDTLLVDLIASGTDVYGVQVNSAVDPSIVAVQSGAFGDFFDSPYLAAINYADAAAGTWDGAASQQNPNPAVTGSGTFATVTYQAITPGSSDVTLTPLFSDRDGFELPGSATACTLTVLDYGSISGTVSYQGRLTHADIEVVATGLVTNNDLTDSNGDFDIQDLQAGDYQVRADVASYLPACAADVPVISGDVINLPATRLLGGDVNDDVETDLIINIGDATRLGASFAQPASADVQADINADGTINVQDLSILGGNYDVEGCQDW